MTIVTRFSILNCRRFIEENRHTVREVYIPPMQISCKISRTPLRAAHTRYNEAFDATRTQHTAIRDFDLVFGTVNQRLDDDKSLVRTPTTPAATTSLSVPCRFAAALL